MSFTFERKINYYETDRMGVVHHSNYIRFLEEARCAWLDDIGLPFSLLEENGITIPVLGVNVTYKHHVTFEDTIVINVVTKEYNGVRMTVGYNITDKATGHTEVTLKNGLKIGQVIPESIEIKKVFLAEKNPVVKLGLVIK